MKPAALHDRIRQDVEARIMSGVWEAGHRVPREHELMVEYDCSRMTVNKAISALVERGLVERRKRAGTFVAAPRAHRAALEIPDIAAEIKALGKAYRLELFAREVCEADTSHRALLRIKAGRVLSLRCLHRADEEPFAWEDRLINLDAVPAALTVDFRQESPGSWLLAHVPWTDARHRITAIASDQSVSDCLAIALGSPCLSIERWTWRTEEERITHVRQIYPGDTYALMADFLA